MRSEDRTETFLASQVDLVWVTNTFLEDRTIVGLSVVPAQRAKYDVREGGEVLELPPFLHYEAAHFSCSC